MGALFKPLAIEDVARVMRAARPGWSFSVDAFVSDYTGEVAYGAAVHADGECFSTEGDDECASLADALQLAYGRALKAERIAA